MRRPDDLFDRVSGLVIFGRSGFDDRLVACAAGRGDVDLVTLADLDA
jgi:hypothetical protein